MTNGRGWREPKMVRWYHPTQLLRTGAEVLIAGILGARSDRRLLYGFANLDPGKEPLPEPSPTGEAVVDYIADTGDGWNPSYAVAYWASRSLAETSLPVEARTPGEVLVLGGDEVYPVASRASYDARLVQAYETATSFDQSGEARVFALPGNHDWYDNLVAFSDRFISRGSFARWRCPQSRSYFAVKLPAGWWLLGVDMQLKNDVDKPQVEYFRQVAAQMAPGDAIVLCLPAPLWREYSVEDLDLDDSANNIEFLLRLFPRQNVRALIAGDLHHYMRHEETRTGMQLITCGGGGAFLHPTHTGEDELDRWTGEAGVFKRKKSFPDADVSRRRAACLLVFGAYNPEFAAFLGVVYLLLAWLTRTQSTPGGLQAGALAALEAALVRPMPALLIAGFAVGTVAFADVPGNRRRPAWWQHVARVAIGAAHASAHLAALFTAELLAQRVAREVLGARFGSVGEVTAWAATMWLLGSLFGSTLFGAYLASTSGLLKMHPNEAFSALRVQDYKSFLRLHFSPGGDLTIFALGLERVPRRWSGTARTTTDRRERKRAETPPPPEAPRAAMHPDDPDATPLALIEHVTVAHDPLAVDPPK